MTVTETDKIHDPELLIPTEKGVARVKPVSEQTLWDKIGRFSRKAGYNVCEKALWLWYAARDPETPKWARRIAFGALAYFVLPLDAVPDLIPGIGFTDDLTALTAAISTVAMHITPAIKDQTTDKLKKWFG